MSTKIAPQQVFRLVGLLPKEMQQQFNKEAYEEVKQEPGEFVPDVEKRYEHSLGLSWLTKHNIPNTVEELEAQRQYVFQTMVSGPETYNVGQFIVVFPQIIYGPRDIESTILVLEVMDELEFPPMPDLVVPYNDEIRKAAFDDQATVALRYALESYVATGKLKVHEAGFRMYAGVDQYAFQDRFAEPTEDRPSFKEMIRRNRQS
jgi:hypothetical protein